MEKSGQVSSFMQYTVHSDHHLFEMYFKDQASCQEYMNRIRDSQAVDLDRQQSLGYRIVCQIS